MVNKAKLITDIANLVKEKNENKRIDGISNIKDESNREGIRVVIDIKRDANATVVLNQLYKHTDMETTFGINNLALVDGEPKTLNLKEMLQCFIDHRIVVVTNRCDFDLQKAQDREHILTGFVNAMKDIDAVVSLIRKSESTEAAKVALMGAKFNFSEDPDARLLADWFERITESEQHLINLERAVKYDKLGVVKALLLLQMSMDRKRLVGMPQYLPLLDRVVKNETYMHTARVRAAAIAEAIRATK
jgi:DNA gyrase subunit A